VSKAMLFVLYFDALIFVLVSCLALFRLYYWLDKNQIHHTNRARTCGTCAYCQEFVAADIHAAFCCRKSYTAHPGGSAAPNAVQPIVRLDWRGCGESEEK
jgi:hypothetical protein